MAHELTVPYAILDVFTDTPLAGNGLAVFTEGEQIPSRLMQATAREMNLSETVFVLPGDAECDAHIRIFTPRAELPFAGHPVLGTAFVIGERDNLNTVRLRTAAGVIPIVLSRDRDEIVFGEMEQPLPTVEPFPDPEALLAAIGARQAILPIEQYTNGPTHVMVALEDVDAVARLAPDLGALAVLGEAGFSCFSRNGANHVKTRMFAPRLGVAEDPATGSAAGPLAVHLVRHGRILPGEAIELTQGVEIGRRSTLHARAEGTPTAIAKVVVGGSAVLVARGHFRLQ